MAYFCFDFRCASDVPAVGLPTVVLEPRKPLQGAAGHGHGHGQPPTGVARCCQGLPAKGRPAAAKPSLEGGGRLRLGPPAKGRSPAGAAALMGRPPACTSGCGQLAGATASGAPTRDGCPRRARKGLSPAASPAASKGGGADCRGGCPLVGRLSAGKCSAVACTGQRWRRGRWGQEGLGHSF
ncbi:hypothetical protein GW17_00014741 [Ensete ventricosum]|nr:hypothetical protein GW17_00014741 [Ensete ventricosum]